MYDSNAYVSEFAYKVQVLLNSDQIKSAKSLNIIVSSNSFLGEYSNRLVAMFVAYVLLYILLNSTWSRPSYYYCDTLLNKVTITFS